MAHELPEHMVFLILLWLPVKSLLRFKAVCKYWYALIESSTFINQHLHHQQKNVNCSLIVRIAMITKTGYYQIDRGQFFILTGDKLDEAPICLDFANEEMRRYKINSKFLIPRLCVGNICNGIICLYISRDVDNGFEDVVLWNPATKQLRPLPLPQFPSSRPPQQNIEIYPFLGFDIKTDDYKVVKIIHSPKGNELYTLSQVEVYNLSTDAWRTIHKDYILPFRDICSDKIVYKNGICFWCGDCVEELVSKWQWHWVLISFDFSTETFRFMPMPNTSRWVSTYALDFLDDNLICINSPVSESEPPPKKFYNYADNRHFDIWVLHGYGTNESWTKLYTIGPFDIFNPKKFLKEREYVVMSKGSRLYLYNLVTQEMRDSCCRDCSFRPMVVMYNESLVSIKGEDDAANREASLLQFARVCGDQFETEEEEDDETDKERTKSQSEEESEEDRETIDLENQISDELDLDSNLAPQSAC